MDDEDIYAALTILAIASDVLRAAQYAVSRVPQPQTGMEYPQLIGRAIAKINQVTIGTAVSSETLDQARIEEAFGEARSQVVLDAFAHAMRRFPRE